MRDYYAILDKHEAYKNVINSRIYDMERIQNLLDNMHDSIINHPENVRLRDHLGVLRQEMRELTRRPVTEVHSILFTSADGLHRFQLAGYKGDPAFRFAIIPKVTKFHMADEPPLPHCNTRQYARYTSQYYPCGDVVHIIHEYKEQVE